MSLTHFARAVVVAVAMLMPCIASPSAPALAAPGTWTQTANDMSVPRMDHAATLLVDGRVLVSGGRAGSGPVAVQVESVGS